MSFRRRLVVLVAGAVVLVGAVVVVSTYVVVRSQLLSQVESDLRSSAAVVGSQMPAGGGFPGSEIGAGQRPPIIPRVIDADGEVVESRVQGFQLPTTPEARSVASGLRESSLETLHSGSEPFAVLTLPLAGGRAMQLAKSLAPVHETLDRVVRASLVTAGGILLVAPLVGYLVAGGALVPVRRLSRTAVRIARTADLEQRAEVRGDDDLASLATSFNAMLDRLDEMVDTLERAQVAQRQLVADASHQLRTPLTTLRANVELLALGSGIEDADREELATDTVAQIDDLTGLMGQLIDLAREDEREPPRAPVQLDQVVEDALDRTRPHYPAVSFAADLEPTTVLGAQDALSRAVSNLLDNAGKWSPPGATVEVHLAAGTLEVRDHGPGIDDADLPHVFQRFYRGAHARGEPGSGLGLAIVGQVVSSHRGEVWAEQPAGGGTRFTMRLPIDGT